MTPGGERSPAIRDVLAAVGEAAKELGAYAQHRVQEQPGAALVAALVAGFVSGGGLVSPLGVRVAAGTLRATMGNATTLLALDFLRRTIEGGGFGPAPRNASV